MGPALNAGASRAAGNVSILTTSYFKIGKQGTQKGGYWLVLGI